MCFLFAILQPLKFSRALICFHLVSLSSSRFFIFLISMNFASLSKSCPAWLKCWSICGAPGTGTSKRCLLSCWLNGHSVFPTYWTKHFLHVHRYNSHAILQFIFSLIEYVLPIFVLLNDVVCMTCLQHLLP